LRILDVVHSQSDSARGRAFSACLSARVPYTGVPAVCCSVLQCVAVCCSVLHGVGGVLQCVAVCCSVLQYVSVCLSARVPYTGVPAVCCSVLQCVAVCCSVLQCVAVCCSVPAVCCSVLQCVKMCCSVPICSGDSFLCVCVTLYRCAMTHIRDSYVWICHSRDLYV